MKRDLKRLKEKEFLAQQQMKQCHVHAFYPKKIHKKGCLERERERGKEIRMSAPSKDSWRMCFGTCALETQRQEIQEFLKQNHIYTRFWVKNIKARKKLWLNFLNKTRVYFQEENRLKME